MSDWDSIKLWSDNNVKFEKLMEKLRARVEFSSFEVFEDGEKLTADINGYMISDDEIKKLSAENPSMTFFAQCSFQVHWTMRVYEMQYKEGEKKVIGILADYLWPVIKSKYCSEEQIDKFIDIIRAAFQRIDQLDSDGKGAKHEIYPFDVMVSAEDNDFKMLATKRDLNIIDVKLFKKYHTFTWKQIEERQEEIPF